MDGTALKRTAVKSVRARARDSAAGLSIGVHAAHFDQAAQTTVTALVKDPAVARQWLQELGYLSRSGQVTRRYGGGR